MDDLTQGIAQAFQLILSGDPALMQIVWLSLQVTASALLIAMVFGIPIGAALGLSRIRAQSVIIILLYTGMGLPPVVVGLLVYLMLSRAGPFGELGWLFTPAAMIVAQAIIAFPLVAGLTMIAVQGVDPQMRLQARSLGATRVQEMRTILSEAHIGVIAAVVAAFGAIISEVGAVMLVGGNIEGKTRVLTTAIVLNTRTGEFALALALGIILLMIAFVINAAMFRLQRVPES
jgi:tungstate transport system permease protein